MLRHTYMCDQSDRVMGLTKRWGRNFGDSSGNSGSDVVYYRCLGDHWTRGLCWSGVKNGPVRARHRSVRVRVLGTKTVREISLFDGRAYRITWISQGWNPSKIIVFCVNRVKKKKMKRNSPKTIECYAGMLHTQSPLPIMMHSKRVVAQNKKILIFKLSESRPECFNFLLYLYSINTRRFLTRVSVYES